MVIFSSCADESDQLGLVNSKEAMMTEWKVDRKGGSESWEVSEGPIRIWVSNGHINNPGHWTMHCTALGMNAVDLRLPADQEAKLAKGMALNMVKNEIKKLSSAIAKLA